MTPAVSKDVRAICAAFGELLKSSIQARKFDHFSSLDTGKLSTHFKVYQSIRVAKLRSELKELENGYAKEWTVSLLQNGPYERGSHPFRLYFLFAYNLLRSELQLWGSTLPSNEESLHVFVSICEGLISELYSAVSPLLVDDKGSASSSNSQNPVVRQVSSQ
jgi:hypothetical protein